MSAYEIVGIGASWGGLHAVGTVLAALGADFGAAVVVAQHRDQQHDEGLLVELLRRRTPMPVAEGEDKGELRAGCAVVAPPGYHLLVENPPGGGACVEVSCDELVQFSRPSIDVLFESVAAAYGPAAIGVVLTGANADGARGLAEIVRRGGYAVVQDPGTAERPEMPRAALAAAEPHAVLPLEEIGPHLRLLCAEAA